MLFQNIVRSKLTNFKNLNFSVRFLSFAEIQSKRIKTFDKELERQQSLVTRIHKININYVGVPNNCEMVMNKDISTPYDCARHTKETIIHDSTLALVNDTLWDMHKPLVGDCNLNFINFKSMIHQEEINKAYWRSCSFLLGLVIENSFKESAKCTLHSWPQPNVKSGSFVYDVYLDLEDWNPTKEDLWTLGKQMNNLARSDQPFQTLDMKVSVAQEIFQHNKFKFEQIPGMADANGLVRVYRVGNHVDLSRGPMIPNTNQLGRPAVTAVHQIENSLGMLYRFQGVSVPSQHFINNFAYKLLLERSKNLNKGGLIDQPAEIEQITAPEDQIEQIEILEKN